VAYVSYSRYRAVAGFLPGADGVALCFTVGIALFMYYASSHVSAFAIELWLRGGSRLAWQGAVLLGTKPAKPKTLRTSFVRSVF
jgi:hypothetical protein